MSDLDGWNRSEPEKSKRRRSPAHTYCYIACNIARLLHSLLLMVHSSNVGKIVFMSLTHMNVTTRSKIPLVSLGFSLNPDLYELETYQFYFKFKINNKIEL